MARIHLERVDLTMPACAPRTLGNWFRCRPAEERRPILREISLTIGDGERIALVGPDGAGKTALLRLLAGLHRPDGGCLIVEGETTWLGDILQQPDADATGWENIEQQVGPGEAARQLAAFTGLEEFLDLPVRCYSTGMRWRLGFSLAASRSAEILLVDGVVGGGDLAFRCRAEQRLRQLLEQARIAIIAGHDLETPALDCRRTVWLDNGRLRTQGPTTTVLPSFLECMRRAA